ncbi:hypothetical protein JTB14_000507 [Gonioctena quinquepunctata]|nr:hypothetical protein JTB14_000507 [Gonioctena quinquepunctata]
MCRNTTKLTPKKTFIQVPRDDKRRQLWLDIVKRDPKEFAETTNVFVCEDHFDLENDMENYLRWKMMGGYKFMKPDAVPHKFECQKKEKPTYTGKVTQRVFEKRRKLQEIKQTSSAPLINENSITDEKNDIYSKCRTMYPNSSNVKSKEINLQKILRAKNDISMADDITIDTSKKSKEHLHQVELNKKEVGITAKPYVGNKQTQTIRSYLRDKKTQTHFKAASKGCSIGIDNVKVSLNHTIDFIGEKYEQFGFDGAFGLTVAEAQLIKLFDISMPPTEGKYVGLLTKKTGEVHRKLVLQLPTHPSYMKIFGKKLLNSRKWSDMLKYPFIEGEITKLGFYKNWTVGKVLQQKRAIYKGIKTDKCLRELLELSPTNGMCYISDICSEMMLDVNRIDTGYLLTHRLLYLQIQRLQGCKIPNTYLATPDYTKKFCSYIYKEAITNEFLGFPYHDIFLEQVVLCGMEGYSEFLNGKWLSQILKWQNKHGCYESIARNISKRTSTIIDYGCSDHSTGLGAAALALFYRYLLEKIPRNPYLL